MKKKSAKLIDTKKNRTELYSLRKSLLNFNFQKFSGQLEKTSEIRKTKRKICRWSGQEWYYKGNGNIYFW